MKNLSLLIAGASLALAASASTFNFNVARQATRISHKMPKKNMPTTRSEGANEENLYNITTLFSEDFSNFNGNDADPMAINVTNEDGTISGLPGWKGEDVYAADHCAYVNCHKVFDDPEYPDMYSVGGQINTPNVALNGAKNIQLKFRAKSAEYDDSEMSEMLNVIVMMVSDEMPGVSRMLDFTWDDITPKWNEDYWFDFELPETFSYDDFETDESYTLPLTGIYVRFYTTGEPFYIGDLSVETREPKVGVPSNLGFKNFTPDGYVATWESVADADRYKVEVFNAEFNSDEFSFDLTEASVIETAFNEAKVDINTAGLTYFRVTAYNGGGQASPVSEMLPVFSVLPPELGTVTDITADSFTMNWIPANGAAMTELWAYRQCVAKENLTNYPFVTLDFSGAESDYSDGAMNLDEYAYGWMAVPYASIEDGALMLDNYGAMWGDDPAQLVSVGAYDLSESEGKVVVKVVAKSDAGCGIVVAAGGYDKEADTTVTLDAVAVEELTDDFEEYTFELDANNPNTMFIIQVLGYDVVDVKSVVVETSFPAGAEFGWPYKDVYSEGTTATISYPEAGEFARIKVISRSIKTITAEMFGHEMTLMEAVSNFSDPLYVDKPTSVMSVGYESDESIYYNIGGIAVGTTRPNAPGVYVKKTGSKVSKIVVGK